MTFRRYAKTSEVTFAGGNPSQLDLGEAISRRICKEGRTPFARQCAKSVFDLTKFLVGMYAYVNLRPHWFLYRPVGNIEVNPLQSARRKISSEHLLVNYLLNGIASRKMN